MQIKKVFLVFLLFFSPILFAQQADKNNFYIRAAFNYGFIMQQHNSIGHLVNGNIGGFELNYVRPTSGDKIWHAENNYPERGAGFSFFNLDNPKQLGNLYAFYFFYDIPLRKKEKPFRVYLRTCEGLAFAPVHFDPITNHKNNVLSSPVNSYVNLKLYYRWNICKRLRWEAGLNFSHASNGRFEVPNLGINLVTFNTGFVYKILAKTPTIITAVDSSSKIKTKNELFIWGAVGLNEVDQPRGKKYVAQSYSAAFYHNIHNRGKIGVGLDVYYNAANLHQLKGDSVHLSSNLENIQVGVKIAYAYNIGRFSLPIEMGYYLYSKSKDDGIFFHRIGMRYYFKNNFVAILSLKTHWAVATYFEFGVGYKIPIKKKIKL
ncbi:MAG: acyloxyacyl hydrolase [Bacteroidia bacterium]